MVAVRGPRDSEQEQDRGIQINAKKPERGSAFVELTSRRSSQRVLVDLTRCQTSSSYTCIVSALFTVALSWVSACEHITSTS